MNKQLLAAAIISALVAGPASAAPFNSFDPISMGMGGAGVAVGEAGTAPFFNPATLATAHEEDDFSLAVPAGVRIYDPDDFIDSLDEFQNDSTVFDNNDDFILDQSINEADIADPDSYRTVATDVGSLSAGLSSVSDRNLQGEFGAAATIGIPSKKFAAALTGNAWGAANGVIKYKDADTLTSLSSDVNDFADCLDAGSITGSCEPGNFDYIDAQGNVTFDPDNDLDSTVDIRGLLMTEIGLSLAREFNTSSLSPEWGGSFAVGITPKYQSAEVFDYSAGTDTADEDDINNSAYIETHSNFNFDIGLAKQYGNGWRTGLVVKNVLEQEYKTVNDNVVTLNPQARLGIARQTDWSTVAVDLDLTENEPVNFEEKTQFLSLGAEMDAFGWAQLRAGYRAELIEGDRNVASVGIGLFNVLDVAVAASGDEMGGALQLGMRW